MALLKNPQHLWLPTARRQHRDVQPMKILNEAQAIEKQGQRRLARSPSRSLRRVCKKSHTDMKTHPHICFVAPHAWPVLSGNRDVVFAGGAEVQQCHLARGLVARGYQVSMLCLDYGQPVLVEIGGIRVHRLFKPNAGWPVVRFLHPRLTALWRGMRQVDADIYYQRGADMHAGVVAAYCRLHGKKSIFAGANDNDFSPGKQLIRYNRDKWLFEYGLARASVIVAQQQAQKQLCWENYRRDSTLIRSCYPAPVEQADPSGGILWVATIRKFKGPERFIELAKSLPDYRFTMIGGPGGNDAESLRYYESIRSQAEAVPNLSFLGFVHPADVEHYFDRARIFVNTSDTEGFPNTFLQAWSRGMPTVSLFDPGSQEDGKLVCATAQDIKGVSELLCALNCDDVLWREMGERCRRYYLRHHALDSVLDAYERLFLNLVDDEALTGA